MVKYWFRPRNDTAQDLAARFRAAGHEHIEVRGDLVGMIPFSRNRRAWEWVQSMQNHFDARFVESDV